MCRWRGLRDAQASEAQCHCLQCCCNRGGRKLLQSPNVFCRKRMSNIIPVKRNASPPESGVKLVASRLVESFIIGFDSMFIDDNRHIICKKKLVKCERIPIPSHAKKTVSRSKQPLVSNQRSSAIAHPASVCAAAEDDNPGPFSRL